MRYLYTLLFYLALPFLFIRLWWKGRKTPGYRRRWRERLGFIATPAFEGTLWIHAVSLGEMIAAKPLILALRSHYPDKVLVITTTTVTGSSLAEQYEGDANVFHCYLPYDIPGAATRFLNRTKPQVAVIMETELWPNLLHYLGKRDIPILLANARLSQTSMQSYLRIVKLTREMLSNITCIAAQTQQDAERFMQLGATAQQIQVMGNVKFDAPLPTDLITKGQALRQSWGTVRPTVIAASTHNTEEEMVLAAFQHLLKHYPNALLILVPRHPERFKSVAELCERKGYNILRRSQNEPCAADTEIFFGDTMGELMLYYALADIAFVGGSFVAVGGHNLLEPALVGLPILTGPNIFNFTEIYSLLHQAGAVLPVTDVHTLSETWVMLIQDVARREKMGKAAKQVVEENRGAVARHVHYLQTLVEGPTLYLKPPNV